MRASAPAWIRPAGHRAGLCARRADRAAADATVADCRARPGSSPGVRAAADRRPPDPPRRGDGLGRCLEGVLPGPARRRADRHPPDVAASSAPARRRRAGAGSGDGLRDRPPPDDPPVPGRPGGRGGSRRAGRGARPRRRVWVRDPGDRGRQAGRGIGVRGRHGSGRRGGDPCERPSQPAGPTGSRAREGSLPSGEPGFDVVLANLIAGVLVPLAPPLRDELRPGGILLASGIFHDREAAVSRRSRPPDWTSPRGPPRVTGSPSRPAARA